MLTYTYHLFLRNPKTGECKVQDISVDSDGYMDANTLFKKLEANPEQFEEGFTVVGLNVGLVTEKE